MTSRSQNYNIELDWSQSEGQLAGVSSDKGVNSSFYGCAFKVLPRKPVHTCHLHGGKEHPKRRKCDAPTERSAHSLNTRATGLFSSRWQTRTSPLATLRECGGLFVSVLEAAAGRHGEKLHHDWLTVTSGSWFLCAPLLSAAMADTSLSPVHWQLWVGLAAASPGAGEEGRFHTTHRPDTASQPLPSLLSLSGPDQ